MPYEFTQSTLIKHFDPVIRWREVTHFHCRKSLFEQPALIVQELGRHGIDLELSSTLSMAVGCVHGESVCMRFHANRFCANLSVLEHPTLLPLSSSSAAQNRIEAVLLFDLGIVPVDFPAEEEIQCVEEHFEQTPAIKSTIDRLKEVDKLKWQMVDEREFQKAAHLLDEQTRLLDRLYELCIGS